MADPEHFKPLHSVAPNVSRGTNRTVMKALELARSQRWQRAEEMAEALGITISTTTQRVITGKRTTATGEEGKTVAMTGPMAPVKQLRTVPLWGWGVGGVIVIALIIGLVIGRGDASPLANATATPTIAEATITPSPPPHLRPDPPPHAEELPDAASAQARAIQHIAADRDADADALAYVANRQPRRRPHAHPP